MPTTPSSALKLDIPLSPEILDPELFKELLRVYNSIRILEQAIGQIQVGTVVPGPASDLPTVIALLNEIRTVLVNTKIAA